MNPLLKNQDRKTLNELLESRAESRPDRIIYRFLSDGQAISDSLTYSELREKARLIASLLQSNLEKGDRVLLLFPQDLNYIAAFFGCLYAGMIAVPAYPPRGNRHFGRIETIVKDSGAACALLNGQIESHLRRMMSGSAPIRNLKLINTDSLTEADGVLQTPDSDENSIAFLQYTSGSTSDPKGVMVTHGNLLENQKMIQKLFRQTSESVILGWLPLYHDMGLIGNILQPLYVDAECYLMQPAQFIQNPRLWLEAISGYRATTSGGPNFAYELCLKRIKPDEIASLDLTSWKVAFNGAEPIHAATLESFSRVFSRAGFDKKSFIPCYGLAEATLLVSAGDGEHNFKSFDAKELEQKRASENERDGTTLVNCGKIADGVTVEIVTPETLERARKNEIGEIWISGASVAKGYWNRPEQTLGTFEAQLKNDENSRFLRTGDLGFLDESGLFVTGRIKDLIIFNGRNLYPQDIEKSVEQCHAALRKECGIAFSVETETGEKIVVVHEIEPRAKYEPQEIFGAIQKVLANDFEVSADRIILVKAGTLPKTTSGKKQRRACRAEFLSDGLEAVENYNAAEVFTHTGTEDLTEDSETNDYENFKNRLKKLAGRILKINPASLDERLSLLSYGLDSLAALELAHSIKNDFQTDLPIADLLESADFETACRMVWESNPNPGIETETTEAETEKHLSAGQKSLWFLHRLAPDSTAYHLNFLAVVKNEDFSPESLKKAFEKISMLHDNLRSTFYVKNGEPLRKIHDRPTFEWRDETFYNAPRQEIEKLIDAEFSRPFDLSEGALLRIGLWKNENEEILLSLSVHHIIADFWSLAVIVRQLGEFYLADEVVSTETDSNAAVAYEKFVAAEKKYLASEKGKTDERFWSERLSGDLPVLEMPFDFPRPPLQTFNGEITRFRVDVETVERLRKIGTERQATFFLTLLAAYKVLLYRYTNQTDIIVGTPTAGRENPAFGSLVGYFVNPVAVRSFPASGLSFVRFLDAVRTAFFEILKHRDFPFVNAVETLANNSDTSRSPVFQTMFIFQQSPFGELSELSAWAQGGSKVKIKTGALEFEAEETPQTFSQFDLSLMLAETDGELSAAIQYNTDLFKRETIEGIGENFKKLLTAIASNPALPIAELELLAGEEYDKTVFRWNAKERNYDRHGSIHKLFETCAENFPQTIAVTAGNARLTYCELNQRANRIAGYLKKRGVENEDRIGVCLKRTENLIAALLGILKSGAAYVPLDPAYPQKRLSLMLDDSQAKFVITETALISQFPSSDSELIVLENVEGELQKCGVQNLETDVVAQNLAYIIYTSGSTGKPKGIAIEHRNVCALIAWADALYSLDETKKVLASTSICFDLSVFEIFFTLARGGEIYLVENALELLNSKNPSGVTLINTVPSAMTELCRQGKIPETAQTVNLAGEPLLGHLIEKVYAAPQVRRLYNLYGPSEDTTYSTFALMPSDRSVNSLIGKPIDNTQTYLLNDTLEPVPVGVVGEIYLGGDGVTRGYFGNPRQTAEKYIPDHLSGKNGARLYKTNDLGKFDENGDLIFLGRSDHQVKIRGFRIELGEIETVIGRHQSVRETTVVAFDSEKTGEKFIAAYIVPNGNAELTTGQIKSYLAEHLTAHMIPASFTFLDALPLTPNGKVDRKKLPAPDETGTVIFDNDSAPRTPIEETIIKEFSEILGGKNIGGHSNFFEVGGHSLSAARVVYRLQEIYEIEIPLRAIFEKPTAARLAEFVSETLETGKKAESPRIEKIVGQKTFRLSPAQRKLWFIEKIRPFSPAYNVPAALRLKGNLDTGALEKAFENIINRHDGFRTSFIEIEGEPFQTVDDRTRFKLAVETVSNAAELNEKIKTEARRGFDLATGELLRVRLWKLNANEHILLLVMHHIVTDGWSLGVMVKEIRNEYARQIGEEFSRAENERNEDLQYADYAEWQNRRVENGELARQIEFWKNKLDGISGVLNLPTDFERPVEPSFKGAKIPVHIPPSVVAGLKKAETAQGVTLFVLLTVALNILLHRYTGETDICIGVPVANRLSGETENIIGFFVNSLVIRTEFGENETVRSLIQKIRKNALEAFSNQEVPFDVLVENLPLKREISRNPIFQVAFAFQNTPIENLVLPGLECEYIEPDTETSKFDLTLDLRETENGLDGHFEYAADLFGEAAVRRMAKHFSAITGLLNEKLSSDVDQLAFLSAGEIGDLKRLSNGESAEYPAHSSLPEIFAQIAGANPSATALVWENGHLTYAELAAKSNALADHLRKCGIKFGDHVAVAMNRSPEAVISLLGILKAGGAYVPIENTFPAERINYVLRDTQAKLILTKNSESDIFANETDVKIEEIETILNDEGLSTAAPEINISSGSAAYVMFTSGSTGQPKGVSVTHRNIARLVKNQNFAKLDQTQVILQFAPLSFDASTLEIWGALLNGGRLVLMPDEASSVENIGAAIEKYGVTTLWLTAGLFHLMVDEKPETLTRLEQLLAGGDVLSPAHVNKFLEAAQGKCTLTNGYGPTENTTFTACFSMREPFRGRSIPVGRAVSNTQVYIVDENLEIVPRGVTGELVAGGDGVSNGYLNKPRLTAESFIPDPFGENKSARLYRTGDLARWREDGTIEFVGRRDAQVKISGYRIEPSEIETVIRLYPSIAQAVVIVEKNSFGEKNLAAFVKTGGENELGTNGLKIFLRKKLPAFMIPPKIVKIAEFPLTVNGKVDKKALALFSKQEKPVGVLAPRTPFEIGIAEIWKTLLDRIEIGIDEDFFELGGHSLLATRLVAALKRDFSVDVPIVKIFENPTVRLQADFVEHRKTHRVVKALNKPITAARRKSRKPETLLKEVEDAAYTEKDAVLFLAENLSGENENNLK